MAQQVLVLRVTEQQTLAQPDFRALA